MLEGYDVIHFMRQPHVMFVDETILAAVTGALLHRFAQLHWDGVTHARGPCSAARIRAPTSCMRSSAWTNWSSSCSSWIVNFPLRCFANSPRARCWTCSEGR